MAKIQLHARDSKKLLSLLSETQDAPEVYRRVRVGLVRTLRQIERETWRLAARRVEGLLVHSKKAGSMAAVEASIDEAIRTCAIAVALRARLYLFEAASLLRQMVPSFVLRRHVGRLLAQAANHLQHVWAVHGLGVTSDVSARAYLWVLSFPPRSDMLNRHSQTSGISPLRAARLGRYPGAWN